MLVVRLGLCQRQAALERARPFVEIAASRFQAAEVAERFHFGLAIAQLFGNAEGLPIPRMGLGVADAAFLVIAGADERADCLREIAALFGFERIDGGIVQGSDAAGNVGEHLGNTRAERGGVQGALADRPVRLGRSPGFRSAAG